MEKERLVTLFTSEKNKKAVLRTLFIYLGIAAFIGLFSGIYEFFSHNVYSAAMVFAFRYPLILGAGMYLAIYFIPTKRVPGILPACAYHFGVGMATARSIFIGVIDIYGTTNQVMVNVYTILSLIFIIIAVPTYLFIVTYWTFKKEKEPETVE